MKKLEGPSYCPSYKSPPGKLIADLMRQRDMSRQEFAKAMNMSVQTVHSLIWGDVPLTHEIAINLEGLFGVADICWLRRESDYRREIKKKGERNAAAEGQAEHREKY